MSKLEELIQELCPYGVEYKSLGELGVFYGGLTGKTKEDFKDGNAKLITYKNVYSNPALKLDVDDSVKITENEKQHTLQYGDVIFTGSSETPDECGISSVITIKPKEDLYLNSFCFFFRFNNASIMLPDFAKHLFRSNDLRYQLGKTASGVTRYNVSKKLMGKVTIPIPPIEVQYEIVRILDSFTELTTEVTAELTARKQQYEYYRDELLTFGKDNDGVEYQSLKDFCEIRSGWGFPNIEQGNKNGDFPFYKVGDMNLPGNEHFMSLSNNYISNEVSKKLGCNPAPEGTIIFPKIGAAIGTNKKRILTVTSCYDNNVMGIIPGDKINSSYLFYLFDSIDLLNFADYSGAMPSIRKSTIEEYKIPIPQIEVQHEIVRILDSFTELTTGLTAELTDRERQYEYYRDKLLTFKKLA